jgi:hypothetical protein
VISLSSLNLADWLYMAYQLALERIGEALQAVGLDDTQASELSPIVLIFLAVLLTYLTSHTFTAFRKYVQVAVILFAVIVLLAVIVK